ncbi:uncharacterized protein L203_106251 [Cryptococcus depauperatus CBS 7841]|uniref:Phosphoglycerate mutase n=1 Tax=Cryptococcus depauperatus CBS 7841 TaxID=1295531 RepID=A0AAJ8M3Z0_9TREE
MLTLTIVRHGESTDNLKPLWAGWSDAPLSMHGMNQAKALGEYFKTTKFDSIFSSDLKRALWTSQQIHGQQPDPKCPLIVSKLLREQYFGEAEHKNFGADSTWARQPGRAFKFSGGESLEDVRERAKQAIHDFIEPLLQKCRGLPPSSKHVVIVAHGIFNSEFLGALIARKKSNAPLEWSYQGMTNTGWTNMEIGYTDEAPTAPASTHIITNPAPPVSPSSEPSAPPPSATSMPGQTNLEPLTVRILCSDVTSHLSGVIRQEGGIGNTGYDEQQEDIQKFFGGGGG